MAYELTSWGLHTIIDLTSCKIEKIESREEIEKWVKNLVKLIGMIPYGEPIIERFGKDEKFGYTCIQLIETSNICAHFAEDTCSVYIDIFSCKAYDPTKVMDFCVESFGGIPIKFEVLERGEFYF